MYDFQTKLKRLVDLVDLRQEVHLDGLRQEVQLPAVEVLRHSQVRHPSKVVLVLQFL